MKIAYLILTHNNPLHLNRLINSLDSEGVSFYIHIDEKSKLEPNGLNKKNVHILGNRTKIYWGGYSIVEASIKLLVEAYKSKNDYYILLSGCDYPIKSNEYIKSFLNRQTDTNFINVAKMPLNAKSFSRLENYFIEGGNRIAKWNIKGLLIFGFNMIARKSGFKRQLPKEYSAFDLYAGSQWWGFTSDFVEYLLNFITNNPTFTNYYKNTYIPDEMFFHTIIMNSPFKDTVKNGFVYTDWTIGKPPYPSIIDGIHFPILHEGVISDFFGERELLFARKFKDDSDLIINLIDGIRK